MSHGSSTKAIFYAFFANLFIAIAKGAAAFYTGSGSMLAEAIHSLADCTNQLLLYLGLRRSERPPTPRHPLGYGKVIYFWSFIVAMLLFSMGGLFSIYEGVHKFTEPEPLNQAWVALAVLGFSVVLEGLSLAGALREIRRIRGTKTFRQWLSTTVAAELLVVFGEDVAALLGLTVAFGFVLLAMVTGNPAWDAAGSICIGAILIMISIFLIVRLKSLLIGQAASDDIVKLVNGEIAGDASVVKIYDLVTMQFGPKVVVAARVHLAGGMDMSAACGVINRIERKIREAVPQVQWTYIEPDVSSCDTGVVQS